MAFARPTLLELRARVQGDLAARATNGANAWLRRAFERFLAWAVAAVAHDLHGHIAYTAARLLPTNCDVDLLAQWGQMLSVPRKQPTRATGIYVFTGTNGSVIVEGTIVQRSDNVRYATTAEVTIASGTASATVEAELAGGDGNADPSTPGALVSPVVGVQNAGAFDNDGAEGGTDLEDVEVWRERVLTRIATTPRGGTSDDYEVWARETPGVTIRDVYVRPLRSGAGTVDVAFTVVDDADPIPTSPQVALVQAYIDSKRPADMAGCTVYAPTAQTQNYTIAIRPNTAAIRAAAEAAIEDMHSRDVGMGEHLLISKADEAVSTAAGEIDHLITVPPGDVAPTSADHIILPGTITWSTLAEP